jgi:hypothetical protein
VTSRLLEPSSGAAPGRKIAAGKAPLASRVRERMGEASPSSWSPTAAAAAAYDYERDPRWAAYRVSLAVSTPPQFLLSPAFDLGHLRPGRGVSLFHTCMCAG